MQDKSFNYNVTDSQGTEIKPLKPHEFNIEEYNEYETLMLRCSREFWASKSGVAVHRRFRVPQVFSYGCKDMEESLSFQLAALKESMRYKMDIPNFLEPGMVLGL